MTVETPRYGRILDEQDQDAVHGLSHAASAYEVRFGILPDSRGKSGHSDEGPAPRRGAPQLDIVFMDSPQCRPVTWTPAANIQRPKQSIESFDLAFQTGGSDWRFRPECRQAEPSGPSESYRKR